LPHGLVWSAGTAKRRTVPESPCVSPSRSRPLRRRAGRLRRTRACPAAVRQREGCTSAENLADGQRISHSEYLCLAANAVATLAPRREVRELAVFVEVVLRSQDQGRRLLLHLVNFTGDMMRPIRSVVPLSGVHVMLDGSFRKAFTLMRPQSLALDKHMPDRAGLCCLAWRSTKSS